MHITIPANKLENVDVDYISLVARGANRVPFRIIKQEKGMINLSNLSSLMKKKDATAKKAEIYGIVLPKAVATEAVLKAIADAGGKVDKSEEKDGTVLLRQMEGEAGDKAVVLKLSDHVGIVLKAFYGNMDTNSDFNEILKTQGFYPGFSMATEALYMAVRNVMMDDAVKSTDDAVAKVDSALDQFHQYVVKILSEVPPTAFKIEKAVADALEAAAKAAAGTKTKEQLDAEAKTKVDAEAKAKAEAEAAAAAAKAHNSDYMNEDGTCKPGYEKVDGKCVKMKSSEEKQKEDLLKEITTSVQSLLSDALKGVNTAITEINKNVTGLATSVGNLTKTQDELKGQVTLAVETAKKAEGALKGLTVGGIPVGDRERKQDQRQEGELGNIDTAFQPGVRKRASAYGSLIAERTRTQK